MLVAALQVGNCLNEGSHLSDAKAVRIESLLKMADLRVRSLPTHGSGNSLFLLHFLISAMPCLMSDVFFSGDTRHCEGPGPLARLCHRESARICLDTSSRVDPSQGDASCQDPA